MTQASRLALADSVLAAERRLRPHVRETPLERSDDLAAATVAAGVAVAAFRKMAPRYAGKTAAIVLCGGSIDLATLRTVLVASPSSLETAS